MTAPSTSPPPLAARQLAALVAAGVLYALVYVLFFPRTVTTMDESAMLNMAYAYRMGTWYADVAGVDIVMPYRVGEHIIPQYPPGMSGLAAALSFLGWPGVYCIGLLFHIATFAVVAAILRRVGVSPLFALLYLLYPTHVVYSRTVMTDLPSGTLITAAFLCTLYRRHALAGFLAGASVLLRTPNAAAVGLLTLGAAADAWYDTRDWKQGAKAGALVVAGALPWLAASSWYQNVIQQGVITKQYTSTNLSVRYLPGTLSRYLFSMNVMLPGMLFFPVFYRRAGRFSLIALAYGYLLLYSLSYYTDFASSPAETLVVSHRYMQAVIPLFLVAYGAGWAWVAARGRFGALAAKLAPAAVAALALVTLGIHSKHQRYLMDLVAVREAVLQDVTPEDSLFCNFNVAKLLHPSWGHRRYTIVGFVDGDWRKHVLEAEERVDAALANRDAGGSSGRIAVAIHLRPYRPETAIEQRVLADLLRRYEVEPARGAGDGGPPNLSTFYIRAKRGDALPFARIEDVPDPLQEGPAS